MTAGDEDLWDVERYGVMLYRANIRGAASGDQLRKAMRDPRGIRAWLNVRRKKVSADDDRIIWRALFALYGIPDEWPRAIQMEWLAGRLASELFPRCQALWKPHGGGPSKGHQEKMRQRRLRLHKKFETFRRANSHLKSAFRAAELFIGNNEKACAAAGFTRPKSFSQAMKEISSGTIG
jgi:hypothetical protein